MENNKDDHYKHFPIDVLGVRIPSESGLSDSGMELRDINASPADELILFPLEQNTIISPTSSIPSTNKPQKTTPGSSSTFTANSPRSSSHRSPIKPKPLSPSTSPPIRPFISKRFISWAIILGLLIYFREEIITSKIYHDFISSFEKNNPFVKNESDFNEFKKGKIIISIDNGDESLFSYINFPRGISGEAILLNEQQNLNDQIYYFVVKPGFVERWYRSEVKIPNLLVDKQRRVYSDNDLKQILSGVSDQNQELILRDWEKRLEFYARVSDLYVIENVAVEFMFNDRESFEQKQTYTVNIPKFIYELLLQKKPINKYNLSNLPSISLLESSLLNNINLSTSLSVGQSYQGGIIVKIDESGQHGYVMSVEDLGATDWAKANVLCDNYSYDGFDDWSLPSIEELREIYSLVNQVSNFQENWYWSSTQDQSDANLAYHLGFISGDEMSVPKEDSKFVRALRKF